LQAELLIPPTRYQLKRLFHAQPGKVYRHLLQGGILKMPTMPGFNTGNPHHFV
jgi:hypothetical protein